MAYIAEIKTEHGTYTSHVNDNRRMTEIDLDSMQKQLTRSGHRKILSAKVKTFHPQPDIPDYRFTGILNP